MKSLTKEEKIQRLRKRLEVYKNLVKEVYYEPVEDVDDIEIHTITLLVAHLANAINRIENV